MSPSPGSIREALGYVQSLQAPAVPSATVWVMPPQILDHGIPKEYRDADLIEAVRDLLRDNRVGAYLHGAPGTGKTRVAWAMLRADRARRMSLQLQGVEVFSRVMADGHAAWQMETTRSMRNNDRVRIIGECADIVRHRHDREWLDEQAKWHHWLVVDDIGFTDKPSAWQTEAIYHLANERRAHQRPTLWTSNLDPDTLAKVYGPAIASRLTGGKVVCLGGQDRRAGPQ